MSFPSLQSLGTPRPAGLYDEKAHGAAAPGIALTGTVANLVQGQMPYLLEIYQGGDLSSSVSLPYVQRIRVRRPGATEIEWTLEAVSREFSQHRALEIDLEGHSGQRYRAGHNRLGEFTYQDGPTLLREFDAFLDRYQQTAYKAQHDIHSHPSNFGQMRNALAGTFLVLRAFREKLHLKVELVDWDVHADVEQHILSQGWKLRLRAYAPAVVSEPANFFGDLADGAVFLTEAINATNLYIALADSLLKGVRSDAEVLREPLRALQRTAALVESAVDGVGDLLALPLVLYNDLQATLEGFIEAARGVLSWDNALLGTPSSPFEGLATPRLVSEGEETLAVVQSAAGALVLAQPPLQGQADNAASLEQARQRVSQGLVPSPPRGDASQRARQQAGQGLGFWEVRDGDTLHSIAQQALGDASRAAELIDLNGALDGQTLGDGRPLEAGALVRLPGLLPVPYLGATPEAVMGTDFLLDPYTADLVLTPDRDDVELVTGHDLLLQALRVRMQTVQGEGVLPSFGLPDLLGQGSSQAQLVYWLSVLAEQLGAEPRVGQVLSLDVQDTGDGVQVMVSVQPVTGPIVDVLAPGPGALTRGA